MTKRRSFRLGALAARVGGALVGDPDAEISALGSIDGAGPGCISHLSNPAYRRFLPSTRASAVILRQKDISACPTNALVVANPQLAFARISQLWEEAPPLNEGIHPSACIDGSAQVHAKARIGPGVAIGPDSRIGSNVRIYANAVVGASCRLDEEVWIMANATLCGNVKLGARSRVHSGAVLGADGFGFAADEQGRQVGLAQLGGVTLGCDVRIGAGTSIDRGVLEDTLIEDGVKIDNQVHIGHNCRIGAHTLICGCVGIAGSTKVGRRCVLAGGAGIGGDRPIDICDGVVISGFTHVSASITEPGRYSGGIVHNRMGAWKRNALRFQSLDQLAKRIAWMEKQLGQGR